MTNPNSLRERVARVIAIKNYHAHGLETMGCYKGEQDFADQEWQSYTDDADAAIAVILEELVSEGMIDVVGVEICKAVARTAKGEGILFYLHGDDIQAALQAAAKKMGGEEDAN